MPRPLSRGLAPLSLALLFGTIALADHGPGTSGGGVSTLSGETMKQGKWSISFAIDATFFDDVSDEDAFARAARSGDHFDALDRSYLTSIAFGYGITDDVQIAASIGYYTADGARIYDPGSGEEGAAAEEAETFDPDGLTDLWIDLKWRFYHGPAGSFALVAGVKAPTGKSDVTNSGGEGVEPASTAGSGAWDGRIGVAHSRFLSKRVTLDASLAYTARTRHDDFKLGDRVDAGVAIAFRLTGDAKSFPQASVFGELYARHLARSEEGSETTGNSGGTTLFVSPGVRFGFSRAVALTLSSQVPVSQDLHGEQLETSYKLSAAVSFTF
ncbi:MAG: transporter [Acidobacteriota bacterium]